jgi:hypothetical protein
MVSPNAMQDTLVVKDSVAELLVVNMYSVVILNLHINVMSFKTMNVLEVKMLWLEVSPGAACPQLVKTVQMT